MSVSLWISRGHADILEVWSRRPQNINGKWFVDTKAECVFLGTASAEKLIAEGVSLPDIGKCRAIELFKA